MGHNASNWLTDSLSNRPFIVGALFLGTYFVPFLVLIGLALAYVFKRDPEEEWETSHFQYLIRTFWIAILGAIIVIAIGAAAVLFVELSDTSIKSNDAAFIALAGLLIVMMPLLVFCGVRIVLSLMKSASQKPMPNPKSWLL